MSDNLAYRSTTACLVAAPLAWLASALISPGERTDTAAQLDVITAHPTRWTAAAVLLIVGTALFVPGLAALAPVARRRMPVLGLVGTGLLGYGLVISLGDCFDQLFLGVIARDGDRASMLTLVDRLDSDVATGVFFATGGLAFTVGSIAVGVALARSGEVPWWAGALVAASLVVNIVGWSTASQAIVAGSCVPLIAGLIVVLQRSAPSLAPSSRRVQPLSA